MPVSLELSGLYWTDPDELFALLLPDETVGIYYMDDDSAKLGRFAVPADGSNADAKFEYDPSLDLTEEGQMGMGIWVAREKW